MMPSIIMSIHPKYADLILEGKKTIELVWTNYDVKTGERIQSIPSSQQSNILSYAEAAL